MVKNAKPDRKALVFRDNRLIESRYSLSLVERRFLLWIVSQIKKDDEDFMIYRVSIQDWVNFCGIKKDSNCYEMGKKMVDNLVNRGTSIKLDESDSYRGFSWFLSVEYFNSKGYIEAQINPNLKPYLLQMKAYTTISLEYAMLLNSTYSLHIYDLLKQYKNTAQKERIIPLDEFREMLALGKKYKLFADLRINILEVAKREINDKTDICFDWRAIKDGRKIVAIHFKFANQSPAVTLDNSHQIEADNELVKKLLSHGVSKKAANNLIADYVEDVERIIWHMQKLEIDMKSGKKIPNPAGWLIKAIDTDYRTQGNLFAKEHEKKQAAAAAERQTREALERTVLHFEELTEEENKRRVREKIDGFSDVERATFDADFLSIMQAGNDFDKTIGQRFKSKGLADALVLASYRIKIRADFPEILTTPAELAKSSQADSAVITALKDKWSD